MPELGERVECPICHEEECVYRASKKNPDYRFWVCEKCGFLGDDDGTPYERLKAECPGCGKTLEIRQVHGERFWWCGDCQTSYTDKDGKPDAPRKRLTAPCPLCGGELRQYERKDGSGKFWKCRSEECGVFVDDDGNDSPVEVRVLKCPSCGSPVREGVSRKTGKPYWRCQRCEKFLTERDGTLHDE